MLSVAALLVLVLGIGAPSSAATCTQPLRWGSYENGRIPLAALSPLSWGASGHRVYPPGAQELERLNAAYRARFGTNIAISDSYRTYDEQVQVKAAKPGLAATPGCSNHGWARALDLGGGINKFGTAQYNWMRENAPAYGWVAPDWARQGGAKPEPWHWEFPGGSAGSTAPDPGATDPVPATGSPFLAGSDEDDSDFNSDGVADVFWADPATGRWQYSPSGTGGWVPLAYDPAAKPSDLRLGDFNNDGTTDVFWANPAAGRWQYSPSGTGGWVPLAYDLIAKVNDMRLGDFNNDGTTDVFWADPATGRWQYSPGGVGGWLSLAFDPFAKPSDLRAG